MATIPHWATDLEQLSFTENNPSVVTFDNYQPYLDEEYRSSAPIPNPPPPPLFADSSNIGVTHGGPKFNTNSNRSHQDSHSRNEAAAQANVTSSNRSNLQTRSLVGDPKDTTQQTSSVKRFGLTRTSAKNAISKLTGNGTQSGSGAKVVRRSSTEHKLYEGTIRGPKIAFESKFVEQARLKAQQRANSVLKSKKNVNSNYRSDKVSGNAGGIVLSENTPPERTGFDLFHEAKKTEWEREGLHPRAVQLRAATLWRGLGDGDPFTGRGRLYWNDKAKQEAKMIHHMKEVEWDRKNPKYPLKPVTDVTVKPARPIVEKREVFELKRGVTGVRSDRVAKDFFEQSLRSSQTGQEIATSIAHDAAKPRGGTLAISRDAPVSKAPPFKANTSLHPWRDDLKSVNHNDYHHQNGSTFDAAEAQDHQEENGEGQIPSASEFLPLSQRINQSLDLDQSKSMTHTRDSVRIMQEGGIGMGNIPYVIPTKGPWRSRPRPEWERPWNKHDRKRQEKNTGDTITINKYKSGGAEKTHDEQKEEDDGDDLVNVVEKGKTGEDHRLNRSKFAQYINSWDAPLSHLIPLEQEQESEQDPRATKGRNSTNAMSSPSRRSKQHQQQQQQHVVLAENARFAQPTAAWEMRLSTDQGLYHHDGAASQHHAEQHHLEYEKQLPGRREVSRREVGGGAPSFGLPYGYKAGNNSTATAIGNNSNNAFLLKKSMGGKVDASSGASPVRDRQVPQKKLTPTSPPHNSQLSRNHIDEHATHQARQPQDRQQEFQSDQAEQLRQQQEHYQHHQKQQQQQQQQQQSQHHQPQHHHYGEESRYIAKHASTEVGLSQSAMDHGESHDGQTVVLTRKPQVETKTRSTSPFDETVLEQVYPQHIKHYSRNHNHHRNNSDSAYHQASSNPAYGGGGGGGGRGGSPNQPSPKFHTRRNHYSGKNMGSVPLPFPNVKAPPRRQEQHQQHPNSLKSNENRIDFEIDDLKLAHEYLKGNYVEDAKYPDLNTLVSAMSGLMTGASTMMQEYRAAFRPPDRKGKRQRNYSSSEESASDSEDTEQESHDKIRATPTVKTKSASVNSGDDGSGGGGGGGGTPNPQTVEDLISVLSTKLSAFDKAEDDIRNRMNERLKAKDACSSLSNLDEKTFILNNHHSPSPYTTTTPLTTPIIKDTEGNTRAISSSSSSSPDHELDQTGASPEFRKVVQPVAVGLGLSKTRELLKYRDQAMQAKKHQVENDLENDLLHSHELVSIVEKMADELIDEILEQSSTEVEAILEDYAQAVFETI